MSDQTEYSTVAPVGEEVHMPEPSALPLINAAALAVTIVSITFNWALVAIGGVIFLATLFIWIRSVRRDIDALPLDHSHH
jgi:hypothetical protein